MATTTNYGWTTPDDTSLVKDGASAIRTLGSSVDTTVKNLNPETTLGDISYRSSTANTNTRLAIGTTGQVLTVSGGVPAWATPGGAGANWSLLNAGGTSLNGVSTVTISGISSADKIFILMVGGSTSSSGGNFAVRFNSDTGSNYISSAGLNQYGATYAAGDHYGSSTLTGTSFDIGNGGNSGANTSTFFLQASGCNAAGVKIMNFNFAGNGTNQFLNTGGGIYTGTSTISSVTVLSNTGNWDAGTVYVYTSA